MTSLKEITKRQQEILNELAKLDTMRQGKVYPNNKSYINTKGEKVSKLYYVLSTKDENQKTKSESIPVELLSYYEQQTENHQLFKKLTREYRELSEDKSKLMVPESPGDDKKKQKLK